MFTKDIKEKIPYFLVLAYLAIFFYHNSKSETQVSDFQPQTVYSLSLNMSFDSAGESVNITTFIPQENERQQLLNENVITNGLSYLVNDDKFGRTAQWSGTGQINSVQYKALLATREVKYLISEHIKIPLNYEDELKPYLVPTEVIQRDHPEIKSLWSVIKPDKQDSTLAVLQAIYNYTYNDIKGAPFKGLTDALTALRLQQASCNGKSRLFVALARLNNIPARLVGGIILNEGSKKTSHQWVEAYVDGHWIPFGPTNGHFATLPANYLMLYKNDRVLFKFTADINFDYLFTINRKLVAPSLYPIEINDTVLSDSKSQINVSQMLQRMGLEPKTVGLFLLFPLCTLVITFLRNVVGFKTFGIFMPMLVGAACTFTGFFKGVSAFAIILLISFISQVWLDKLRLLKIPRLAAIITINTLFFIIGLSMIGTKSNVEFGMLSLFPVVIISFIAEKIHNLSDENNWKSLILVSMGSLFSIWLCYLILNSFLLEGVFSFYPEFYLLVLAAQIYIGQWTGLRITELKRFKSILTDKSNPVLGINKRNRDFVYELNEKGLLKLAADKLACKEQIKAKGGAVPDTLLSISSLSELHLLDNFLLSVSEFALKPNQGAQGNGILIIVDKKDDTFISAGGKKYNYDKIKRHCTEILSGNYSQNGDSDTAYFEPLIKQHNTLQQLAPFGLSDIRVILTNGNVVSAMLRLPTKQSDGKANLHQGAVGVAVDAETGITINARIKQTTVSTHPDNQVNLIGVEIPFWKEVLALSKISQSAINLGYIGVDICIDASRGPVVLEVNGRPGIEIQNIHNRGLYRDYQ